MSMIDQAAMSAIHAAHRAVLEAEDAFDRREGKRGTRDALVVARKAERDVLRREGFATYGDFLLFERGDTDQAHFDLR